MNMRLIDWAIVVGFYLFLVAVGLWTRRFMRGVADFLVAGRGMRKYLGYAAGDASSNGAASTVGAMELVFRAGPAILFSNFIPLLWGLFIGKTGFIVHRYRETKILTTPELYERRYSKGVRVYAGAVCALSGILNMAIFPIVAGRFFVYYSGLPLEFSFIGITWPTVHVLTAFLIGAAIAFAFMGGQVSVVVTDFIQAIMMSFMFIALGYFAYRVVSWDAVSAAVMQADNTDMLLNPFSIKSEFGLMYIILYVVTKVFGTGAWAPAMQKISAASNPREARLIMLLFNLRIFATSGMFFCGLAAFAAYTLPEFKYLGIAEIVSTIEPAFQKQMIAPILLTKVLPVGIMGLLFAGMMAAFISTNDSYLLTWAGIIIQDVVYPLRKKKLERKQHLRMLRITVLIIGVLIYIFGIFYKGSEAIVIFQFLTGALYTAGAGTLIMLGLYWRRGNTAGAYAALSIGAAIPLVNYFLQQLVGDSYPISGLESGVIAYLAAFFSFIIVSLCTRNPHYDLDKLLNRPSKIKQ